MAFFALLLIVMMASVMAWMATRARQKIKPKSDNMRG